MKARLALELGRVSNLPTVWTNVMAGALLSGGAPSALAVAALALAHSFFYVGGMFLNDAFDRGFDARTRPERPIPSGRARAEAVFLGGFVLLALGLAGVAAVAWASAARPAAALASGAALAGLIVVYDAFHKGSRLAPFLMGLCRGLVYLTAALAVGRPTRAVLAGGAVLAVYVAGLSSVARQETRSRFQAAWPVLLVLTPIVLPPPLPARPLAGALLGLLAAWVAWSLSHLLPTRGPRIPAAVTGLIAAISLVDARRLAMEGFAWPAGAAVAAWALTLLLQRRVRGT